MKDKDLKWILGFAFRQRIFDQFDPDDLEAGIFAIPEQLVVFLMSDFLKPQVMKRFGSYLEDFILDRCNFIDGKIYMDVTLKMKLLGSVSAKYVFDVQEAQFNKDGHRFVMNFTEDLTFAALAGFSSIFKSMTQKDSYLEMISELSNDNFFEARGNSLTVDLDRMMTLPIPSKISMDFLGARNGRLEFAFFWEEDEEGGEE